MKVLGLTLLFAATTVQAEVLSCTAAEDSIKMIPSLIFNTTTKSASVEYALASKPINGKLIGERALDVDNEQGAKKYNLYFKHPDTRIIYDESEIFMYPIGESGAYHLKLVWYQNLDGNRLLSFATSDNLTCTTQP